MDSRSAVPPLNQQFRAYYLIMDPFNLQHPGEQGLLQLTPLRWLLDILEDIIYVKTLADANGADIISDPKAYCPVCLETYKIPGEETAMSGTGHGSQLQRNGRPLKLECGNVICKACLREIIHTKHGGGPKCPLCRDWIHKTLSVIPLVRNRDREPDIVGLLCCAIRLYILFNPAGPETHEELAEWLHCPTFVGQTPKEHALFTKVRNAVDIWKGFGEKVMWDWILARRRGRLPNEELGSEYGESMGMNTTYTAVLSLGTPVLRCDDFVGI